MTQTELKPKIIYFYSLLPIWRENAKHESVGLFRCHSCDIDLYENVLLKVDTKCYDQFEEIGCTYKHSFTCLYYLCTLIQEY